MRWARRLQGTTPQGRVLFRAFFFGCWGIPASAAVFGAHPIPALKGRTMKLFAALALTLLSLPALAQWRLDNGQSDLRFVTTKNTNLAEVQRFKTLSGELLPSGAVRLVIDLASVDTLVPLRNERMVAMLFEAARFPNASFQGQVDMAAVNALQAGQSLDMDVQGQLSLRNKTQDTRALLRVTRLASERLQVHTRAPILVFAEQFDLSAGIEKLREIMNLPNIIGTVPVSFALTFQRQP
jgi:polyisoprenoid-binding protein YceI